MTKTKVAHFYLGHGVTTYNGCSIIALQRKTFICLDWSKFLPANM